MTIVGEEIRGNQIGKSKYDIYVWVRCPNCGFERYVEKLSFERHQVPGRCTKCALTTPDFKERARRWMIGRKNALGHILSDEFKTLASIRVKKDWQNSEFVRKQMVARNVTPNQSELRLQELIISLNLPYKFVGDGQFIIGGKCPDFVNVNGQKKLIELFGDYWHKEDEVESRINYFSQFGFNTLIIWESELSNTELLSEKILLFNRRCNCACT